MGDVLRGLSQVDFEKIADLHRRKMGTKVMKIHTSEGKVERRELIPAGPGWVRQREPWSPLFLRLKGPRGAREAAAPGTGGAHGPQYKCSWRRGWHFVLPVTEVEAQALPSPPAGEPAWWRYY